MRKLITIMLYLPMRKFFKFVLRKRKPARKDRVPASLTECLLKESNDRDVNEHKYFIIILLILIISLLIIVVQINSKKHIINIERAENIIENKTKPTEKLPICHINTTSLGQVSIKKLVTKNVLDQVYPDVQKGGYYIPKDCQTRNKVGILVPYRDRALHLPIFLYNIHPFLIKQKLEYRIFIIEQAGEDLFNRGRLFNAGFLEIMKLGDWKCVIFHDVDLLPLDEEILYTCPIWPRNMCANIVDKTNPKSRTLFGGVSAIDVKQFKKVNGYSNDYWGWGGEDNDLFRRLQDFGYPVVKYDKKIARYTSLPHLGQSRNKDRFNLLHNAIKRFKHEGLSTLRYKVLSLTLHHLYTYFLIDINPYKENAKEIVYK